MYIARAGQRSGITNLPRAGKNAAGKDKPGQQDGAGPTGAQPPAQDDAQVVGFGPGYAPAGPVDTDAAGPDCDDRREMDGVGRTESRNRRGRAAPAPRHLLPDRVRHWARSGQSPGRTNTGGRPFRREAPICLGTTQQTFRPERSEAGTKASGRRRVQAGVGPTEQQYRRGRAAPEPRHLLPDRVRHWARGGG